MTEVVSPNRLVDAAFAEAIPPDAGIVIRSRQLWRPVRVLPPDGRPAPAILAVNEYGVTASLTVDLFARMNHLGMRRREPLAGHIALLQHQVPEEAQPEAFYRVLELSKLGASYTDASILYGEHPDYPGESGFYLRAREIGRLSLSHAQESFKPQDPSSVRTEYFPIPSASKLDAAVA